jgi:hypothetical protein
MKSREPKSVIRARREQGRRIRGQLQRSIASAYAAQGLSIPEIAEKMGGISEGSVRRYLADSMTKVAHMSEVDRVKTEDTKRPAPPTTDRGKAIELRIAGWTHQAIGDRLGYDESTIRIWVREEMERLHALEVQCMDSIRRLQLERLEHMLEGLWAGASNGNPKAVEATLKVLDRQAKLLGLDAPEKVELEHHIQQIAEEYGLTEEDKELAIREVQTMLLRGRKG